MDLNTVKVNKLITNKRVSFNEYYKLVRIVENMEYEWELDLIKNIMIKLLKQDRLDNLHRKKHLDLFEMHYEELEHEIKNANTIYEIKSVVEYFKFDKFNILEDIIKILLN